MNAFDSSKDLAANCLAGKTAMITGGAQGIGHAIVRALQQAGANVVIVDCDQARGEALVHELNGNDPDRPTRFIPANLESLEDIAAVGEQFAKTHHQLDVLVNNAGIEMDKPFEKITPADWNQIQAVNLMAPVFLTQKLLPFFPPTGGVIINMSSVHATHAFPNAVPYACSKAALIALTRNLALELAPRHIRVNAICPGYIDTRLWDTYVRNSPDPTLLAAQTTALHPLGRRGVPEDVARAAVFLATEASSFITGTHLVVDGGLTIRAHP
jgi:NAD(P)-dependent dehydrogenase (short-subunit alcohol dehydrogenase family)